MIHRVHRKPIPGGAPDGTRKITACSTLCQIMGRLIGRKHQKLQMDPNLLSNWPQEIGQAMLAFLILLGSPKHLLCLKSLNLVLATTLRPDAGLHLATVGVLPVWWAFKFQNDDVRRGYASVFDTDRLEGCFLHYFWNGTCYQIDVGVAAVISNKTESECPFSRGAEGEHYLYHRSMYGTQIFRSQHSCSSSLTASREFEFEIADVRFHNDSSLTSASSIVVNKCRTVLRLAVDVNAKCHAIYEGSAGVP